jgi:hypothetical protein
MAAQSTAAASGFAAFRRPSTVADQAFGAEVASQHPDMVAANGLDPSNARLVVTGSAANGGLTAGLLPGSGNVCFIASSVQLGTMISCVPAAWAASNNGLGFVTTVGTTTVAVGVVPDGTSAVSFREATGRLTPASLNSDAAYAHTLATRAVGVAYTNMAGVVSEHKLAAPRPTAGGG